jgi:hypothetical protein
MRRVFFALTILMLFFAACEKSNDNPNSDNTPDTIKLVMGSGYANDIYYKLDSGVVATVPRTNWDIAFHTAKFSSTIITNGGNDVVLYESPQDTTQWNATDTTGLYSWDKLYNSDTTWTLGAFERTTQGHPDYGWGKYNDINHDLIGNKIFIIKLANGQFKKIWIVRKYSTLNKYKIKYADINGANEYTEIIDCNPYTSKNFVYYSLGTNSIIDREPSKEKWDLLLTKYKEMVPTGTTTFMPYTVTGILTNTMRLSTMGNVSYSGIVASQLDDVDHTVTDYTLAPFKTSMLVIGSDWKTFNMSSNTYDIKDNVIYFVKNNGGNIFRLVFLSFEGSATGALSFEERKVF